MNREGLITGKTYIAKCVDFSQEGQGIARAEGFPVFVLGLVPDETAEIEITGCRKNIFTGKITRILAPSENRTVSDCPYYEQCGGCTISHVDYETQLKFKKKHIDDCLERIAGVDSRVEDIISDKSHQYGYRNKISFPVRKVKGKAALCMFEKETGSYFEVRKCLLADEKMNFLMEKISHWIKEEKITPYNSREHTGYLRRVIIRKASDRYLINLIINSRKEMKSEYLSDLCSGCDFLSGITYSCNTRRGDDQIVDGTYLLAGEENLEEVYDDLHFSVSSESFAQVNKLIAEKLYRRAIDISGVGKEDDAVDLYCGIGTISLLLSRQAGHVLGVEVVEKAVRDAVSNSEKNGIENVSFLCSTVEKAFPEIMKNHYPKAVFLDPPRKGCDEKTLQSIIENRIEKVVYISCNPSTLARDIKVLKESYHVEKVIMADMFPNTMHVETVVALSHQNAQ